MTKRQKQPKEGVGKRIEAHRVRMGLTQAELSQVLDISRSGIAMWERGERNPSLDDVIKLCTYFQITSDELIFGVKPNNADIYKETGLSDSAIEALREFKYNDTSGAEMEALSKAIAYESFLFAIARIMDTNISDKCVSFKVQKNEMLEFPLYTAFMTFLNRLLPIIRKGEEVPTYEDWIKKQVKGESQ